MAVAHGHRRECLFAFHEGKQIVRVFAVRFGFDVFIAVAAGCNDDINGLAVNLDVRAARSYSVNAP